MKKRIYIDADSILYRAAHIVCCKDDALEEALALAEEGDDDSMCGLADAKGTEDLDEMVRVFNSMVAEITIAIYEDAVAKEYAVDRDPIIVLTVKKSSSRCNDLEDNFRYEAMLGVTDPAVKGYKANRADMAVPDGLLDIYEYVYDLDNTICIGGVEADDVCVHYGRQGHIVAALDKDVLGSLEYAYNFNKKEFIENTPEEIMRFPYFQTITGDTSDGLRGVYRVGKVGADKALAGLDTHYAMWKAVVMQYALKDQTVDEAIATMRCVLMNQWTPEAGLVYWYPPSKSRDTVQTFNKDPNAPRWKYVDTGEEIPNE